MRIAGAIACLSLLIPNVGSPRKTPLSPQAELGKYWDTPALLRYRQTGAALVANGHKAEAAKTYERGYQEAVRLGDKRSAIRFMNNVGACRSGMLQYREAMNALLLARKMAMDTGDEGAVKTCSLNLSTLYLQMGDLDAAVQSASRGIEILPPSERSTFRIQNLSQLATVRSRQKNLPAAAQLFREAIALAERAGEYGALGQVWNHFGYEYLEHGMLQQSEAALLKSYQILSSRNDRNTYLVYPNLGRLYLSLGNLAEAEKWMDAAIAAYRGGGTQLPEWYIYQSRGLVRRAQRRPGAALEDFRRALQSARYWRLAVVPANALRVNSEVRLQNIYDSFLAAGYEAYRLNPSRKLLIELFLAAEENRAWSLRQSMRKGSAPRLPDEYFELLAQLRSLASQSLRPGEREPQAAKSAPLRSRLMELEAAGGLHSPVVMEDQLAFGSLQQRMKSDEALLTFHLSGPAPLLFTLTRNSLTVHPLPAPAEVSAASERLRTAVTGDTADIDAAASSAYRLLLGALPRAVETRRHWLLALDAGLFELPWAALRTDGAFLIEKHSLTMTPHASLRGGIPAGAAGNVFLGIGDPVYNRADTRWLGRRQLFGNPWSGRDVFELPRLPGTGRELEHCARVQGGETVLLTGPEATAERLNQEILRNPSIIHLAVHVVPARTDAQEAMLALSLQPDGESSLLTQESISALHTNALVVTMSGCGSGIAQALPGAGLMGLTRAWLEAGAHSVAASLWPVADDSGELLSTFYGAMRAGRVSASEALQAAQIANLHSGSWRAKPRHWAAYFIAGKD